MTARRAFRPRLEARTRRLDIRPLERRDFAAWLQANRDRLPKQNMYDAPPRPARELDRQFFLRLVRGHAKLRKLDRFYLVGLFERARGALVGTMSVHVVARGPVQLGWNRLRRL